MLEREILLPAGLTVLAIIFTIALMGVGLWAAVTEQKEWYEFKAAHQCKKIGHVSGDIFNTYNTDAKGNFSVGVGSTSSKDGWLCNDGVTYWR